MAYRGPCQSGARPAVPTRGDNGTRTGPHRYPFRWVPPSLLMRWLATGLSHPERWLRVRSRAVPSARSRVAPLPRTARSCAPGADAAECLRNACDDPPCAAAVALNATFCATVRRGWEGNVRGCLSDGKGRRGRPIQLRRTARRWSLPPARRSTARAPASPAAPQCCRALLCGTAPVTAAPLRADEQRLRGRGRGARTAALAPWPGCEGVPWPLTPAAGAPGRVRAPGRTPRLCMDGQAERCCMGEMRGMSSGQVSCPARSTTPAISTAPAPQPGPSP